MGIKMRISSKDYSVDIDNTNGHILSLSNGKKEFIAKDVPLISISLRDKAGVESILDSDMALLTGIEKNSNQLNINYIFENNIEVSVRVEFEDEMRWYCKVKNKTENVIEWVRCPQFCVPLDLIGNGGKSKLLWGFNEGVVIEDIAYREKGFGYHEPNYPGEGTMPIFPAIIEIQCMAYYDTENGLYIATHDKYGNIKSFDFCQNGEKIEFDIRNFTGADFGEDYEQTYPFVFKMFSGEWHEAAAIYRDWFEKNKDCEYIKITDNKILPEWYKESPIVITYPVRGRHDMDAMNPNKMFPYMTAMKHIERISKELDSKIMVLLMHWEGTAPWAPPYVWPPYGGEECLKEFIDALHESGNLIGVYCSGIGWTEQSHLIDDYNRTEDYEKLGLKDAMCASPTGEILKSHICTGIRSGYDFCPTREVICEILKNELTGMVNAGIDYVQVLDQNHGGNSYLCYSKKHGHPPVPGKWQAEAMKKLLKQLNVITQPRKVLLGCESAAAETYIPELLFSDNRYNLCYNIGRPVPLYGFIYHEYINNFSGNQVCTGEFLIHDKSPENLCMRIAHSFVAGDVLTLVLNDNGEIAWNWGPQKTDTIPDQNNVITLVHNLNYWRKKYPNYLVQGRMIADFEISTTIHALYHYRDYEDMHNDVYSSCWTDGSKKAQFLVNYNTEEKKCKVRFNKKLKYKVISMQESIIGEDEELNILVPPLSAILIEL